jgi:hypothetical protein
VRTGDSRSSQALSLSFLLLQITTVQRKSLQADRIHSTFSAMAAWPSESGSACKLSWHIGGGIRVRRSSMAGHTQVFDFGTVASSLEWSYGIERTGVEKALKGQALKGQTK